MKRSWRWQSWVFVLGFAAFFALVSATRTYVDETIINDRAYDWWSEAVPRGCIDWFLWGALAPLIFQMVRVLLRTKLSGLQQFAVHAPLAILMTSVYILLNATVTLLWDWMATSLDRGILLWDWMATSPDWGLFPFLLRVFFEQSMAHFSIYSGIVAACYAFQYYRPALRASQLEARMTKAKLQSLQMQLQPHFLFNTLNSISALVHKDPEMADRMITRLSDLLRLTLSIGERQEVPLPEELGMLDRYLEIESIRFQDRLRVEKHVTPSALEALVPAMILQPLVENSIRHGITRRVAAGRIDIRADRRGASLVLEVEDDGPGIAQDPEAVIGNGVGLSNCRERLRQLYGEEQTMELISPEGPGLVVRLELPFRDSSLAEV